jgi:formylglycine-generating enzyme required for sulfatase activity
MSAIFISYTNRDELGKVWGPRVGKWLRAWGYQSVFRDQDPHEGLQPGEDWRQQLHEQLVRCRLLIAVCSPSYDDSPWCNAEIAIAIDRGYKLIPIRVGEKPLPKLLQTRQAITVQEAIHCDTKSDDSAAEFLRKSLEQLLQWRDRLPCLPPHTSPFPGLEHFEEALATVYFGRDAECDGVIQRVCGLAGRDSEFLLLLGASGCGKSSLLRAGVIPQLRSTGTSGVLVMKPFRPDLNPFLSFAASLRQSVQEVGLGQTVLPEELTADSVLEIFQGWRCGAARQEARVVVPIDQFEELLLARMDAGKESKGFTESRLKASERFLRFLEELLVVPKGGLVLLATMRSDFLPELESQAPGLNWQPIPIKPLAPALFVEVIEGPSRQTSLQLEPGLKEQLVADTGSSDALPLLAFTLKELWGKHRERGFMPVRPGGRNPCHLLWSDYVAIGGVSGSVKRAAERAHQAEHCGEAETRALRKAFLDYLVRLSDDGLAVKQKARRDDLPPLSKSRIDRFIEERLLVSDSGMVEITHESLLRNWPTLVGWLVEGREELLQRYRVERLCADLVPERQETTRRAAMEELARMAAAGGSDRRAVEKEALGQLETLLKSATFSINEREDAALLLALIEVDRPLRDSLSDNDAPVSVRRRAAESLGLLASRTGDPVQRRDIEQLLEGLLRNNQFEVLILDESGWAEHDTHLPLLQGVSRGLQLSYSTELPLLGTAPGRIVPMLTLSALEENGLKLRTAVVEVPVWKLPLPDGEQLELVIIPEGEYLIGSPEDEDGRDLYKVARQKCEDVNAEALRIVKLNDYALVRHPITQKQWRSIVRASPVDRKYTASYYLGGELSVKEYYSTLNDCPGSFEPRCLWERYGQPGALPVDSVSWFDCQEWLKRLNTWIATHWEGWMGELSKSSLDPPQLSLPSESQWEAACRGGGDQPFHFGITLDSSWANYNGNHGYFYGRQSGYRMRPVTCGFFGLVSRWGLAEMHGQLLEWCLDHWHRSPLREGHAMDGSAWEDDMDPGLAESPQDRSYKLLRGGSWISRPQDARSAFRSSLSPDHGYSFFGFRPACIHINPDSP